MIKTCLKLIDNLFDFRMTFWSVSFLEDVSMEKAEALATTISPTKTILSLMKVLTAWQACLRNQKFGNIVSNHREAIALNLALVESAASRQPKSELKQLSYFQSYLVELQEHTYQLAKVCPAAFDILKRHEVMWKPIEDYMGEDWFHGFDASKDWNEL